MSDSTFSGGAINQLSREARDMFDVPDMMSLSKAHIVPKGNDLSVLPWTDLLTELYGTKPSIANLLSDGANYRRRGANGIPLPKLGEGLYDFNHYRTASRTRMFSLLPLNTDGIQETPASTTAPPKFEWDLYCAGLLLPASVQSFQALFGFAADCMEFDSLKVMHSQVPGVTYIQCYEKRSSFVESFARWMEAYAHVREVEPKGSIRVLECMQSIRDDICPSAPAGSQEVDNVSDGLCSILEAACSLRNDEFKDENDSNGKMLVPNAVQGLAGEESDVAWTGRSTIFTTLAESLVDCFNLVVLWKRELLASEGAWSNRIAHPYLLRLKAVRLLGHVKASALPNGGLPGDDDDDDDDDGWDSS